MAAADHGNLAVCIAQAARRYGADGGRIAALIVERGGKSGEIRQLPNGEFEILDAVLSDLLGEYQTAVSVSSDMLGGFGVASVVFSLLGGAYYSKGKVPTPGRQAQAKAPAAPRTGHATASIRRERIIAADRIFRA